jgi:NADH-quinone oxidoreductase subunit C
MDDCGAPVLRGLLGALPAAVLETHAQHGDATAIVERAQILDVLGWLRDDSGLEFDMLTDLTAVDYLPRTPRFEVVYHLYSATQHQRVRIKVQIEEGDAALASAVNLYPSANWMEREVWDLYGIIFDGHPDLRRILLYEEFEGHPLRKDYPKERRQPLVGPRN